MLGGDIKKLKLFNHNTKFSNLSSEERAALKNVTKRRDIIVKAADKGGALVVWRAALQIFRDFNSLGEDKPIFTMDITSLYTVIPNGEVLLALKHFLIYALLRIQARKHPFAG